MYSKDMKLKKCPCCNQSKEIKRFHRCSTRCDGLAVYCKKCRSQKMKASREYHRKYNAWRYNNDPEFRKRKIATNNKYQEYNKLKNQARWTVKNALKNKTLLKKPCMICKKNRVEAHHIDYKKPLEIIWLCSLHHKQIHRQNLDEKLKKG